MSKGTTKRGRVVRMRLSDAELETFRQRAAACGLALSRYIREAALGHAPHAKIGKAEKEAAHQLARVGNNLNQLARHANASQRVRLSQRLEQVLKSVEDAVRRLA